MNIKCSAIRSLGIFNSYDKDLEQKLNFVDNIKTLNDVLKFWEFRGLTLAGRILVFKSLALSRLLYPCTMKVPSKFSSSINSILCIKKLFGIISDQKLNILRRLRTIVKVVIKMSILKTELRPQRSNGSQSFWIVTFTLGKLFQICFFGYRRYWGFVSSKFAAIGTMLG